MIALATACSRARARARQSASRASAWPDGGGSLCSGSTLIRESAEIRCCRANASPATCPGDWHAEPPVAGRSRRASAHLGAAAEVFRKRSAEQAGSYVPPNSESARGTAARFLLRLVDPQRPTAEVGAVERLDGARGIGTRHLHEAEAARTAGFAVRDERDLLHGAMLGKQCTKRLIGRRERQVADVYSSHRTSLTLKHTLTSVAAAHYRNRPPSARLSSAAPTCARAARAPERIGEKTPRRSRRR